MVRYALDQPTVAPSTFVPPSDEPLMPNVLSSERIHSSDTSNLRASQKQFYSPSWMSPPRTHGKTKMPGWQSVPAKESRPQRIRATARPLSAPKATTCGIGRDGGRISKRKRRTPTRSLRGCETLRVSYLDDYQRDPMGYSRALMDTERFRDSSKQVPMPAGRHAGRHSLLSRNALSSSSSSSSSSHVPSMGTTRNAMADSPRSGHNTRSTSFHSLDHGSLAIRQSSIPQLPAIILPTSNFEGGGRAEAALRKSASASIALFLDGSAGALDCHEGGLQVSARSSTLMIPSSVPPTPLVMALHSSKSSAALQFQDAGKVMVTPSPVMEDLQIGPYRRSSAPTTSASDVNQFTTDDISRDIFNLRPHTNSCPVKWAKAAPMDVSGYPMAEVLAPAERDCCSILRLLPEQYLTIKQSLVRAGRTLPEGTFKKRDAQKLCRVDVNKTSKVFEWFVKLGWIPFAAGKAQHHPAH
ncbi:hypothetical protein DL89DRAFT_291512 [Linderina pennispora]|uniref:SWIRM domain-containing protein n=1 Tax=Linderina pennispora TaxID=61395 RepID=A0A1Y1WFR2_9FUNG|nr:uncharacterized protein DL89DRAFT_291512 [Linderina pennispora]ORX72322.1 hypothetical protein DL89DRAFT_291512 [Linderina pennispora]